MAKTEQYITDYGGRAERKGDRIVFVEKPRFPGIGIGDEIPEDWRLLPANSETHEADERAIPDNTPLNDEDIVFIDQ